MLRLKWLIYYLLPLSNLLHERVSHEKHWLVRLFLYLLKAIYKWYLLLFRVAESLFTTSSLSTSKSSIVDVNKIVIWWLVGFYGMSHFGLFYAEDGFFFIPSLWVMIVTCAVICKLYQVILLLVIEYSLLWYGFGCCFLVKSVFVLRVCISKCVSFYFWVRFCTLVGGRGFFIPEFDYIIKIYCFK